MVQGSAPGGTGGSGNSIGKGFDDLVAVARNPARTPRDQRSPEKRGRGGPANGRGSGDGTSGADAPITSKDPSKGPTRPRDPTKPSPPSTGSNDQKPTDAPSEADGDETDRASQDKAPGSTQGEGFGSGKTTALDGGSPKGVDEGGTDRVRAPAAQSATAPAPAGSPQNAADSAPAPEGDPALPVLDVRRLEGDTEALKRAGEQRGTVTAHPLHGTWMQRAGDSSADFGVGGYTQSLISIDMIGGVATVLRVVGTRVPIVMPGEFRIAASQRATAETSGECNFALDPSLGVRFPQDGASAAGAAFTAPQGTGPWQLTWSRHGEALELGGKSYLACSPAAFESLRRDGPAPDDAERVRQQRAAAAANAPESARATKVSTFMGVKGGGSRFMFIVDCSGSMGAQWGSTNRFEYAKEEMIKSIEALPDGTEFSVVFFTDGAGALKDGWLEAGPDTNAAIARIKAQGLMGGTDPHPALQYAFAGIDPIPDCIFLLTDGLIPTDVPQLIQQLNNGATLTQINTLGFDFSPQAQAILQQIADENEGEFRLVKP